MSLGANEYIVTGFAAGNYEADDYDMNGQLVGKVKKPYANIYVVYPTSDYVSEDYKGEGYKAEKKKCCSPDVWAGISIGEVVNLFFDNKKAVQFIRTTGKRVDLDKLIDLKKQDAHT